MAQNDILKRYLDTGLNFTSLTQARAEALVKDLVRAGEIQADQAREAVADLLVRSRRNSEKMLDAVRREVKEQITSLGLVSKVDLDRAEQRLSTLLDRATGPMRTRPQPPDTKEGPVKKAAARKAPAKGTAKKTTAKKASAKRAGAATTKAAPKKQG